MGAQMSIALNQFGGLMVVTALASMPLAGQATSAAPALAQARDASRALSVWDGVYTSDQAARGRQAYDASCSSCHGTDLAGRRDNRALAGSRFWEDWGEDSLGTFFAVVRKTMPRGASGSLAEPVYFDIVAYVLQKNGYPGGDRELTAASVDAVRVTRKEGPGPVPNFSLVWVVGCLTEESRDAWVLTAASEPVKTRNPEASEGAERDRSSATPFGPHTFGLMDVATKGTANAGKKVEAKGLLIRGTRDKLNLTSIQPLPGACAP
jgi:S-disulfanyl-L-cysteine oxidoreductase SoxD